MGLWIKKRRLRQKKPVIIKAADGADVQQKWEELGHWNESIVELTADILKLFTEMDPALMGRCNQQYDNKVRTRLESRAKKRGSWSALKDKPDNVGGSSPPPAAAASVPGDPPGAATPPRPADPSPSPSPSDQSPVPDDQERLEKKSGQL